MFLLGRELMDAPRAAAGAVLLSGVVYFTWVTPEFNHNVMQMPLWAGLVLVLWRAREEEGIVWWSLVGVLGAVGLYAKFSTVLLLLPAAIYILADPKCRRQIATPGPWVGLAAFVEIGRAHV